MVCLKIHLYSTQEKASWLTKTSRNVVLAQMEKYDFIDETVKDSLQKTDLDLNYSPESHREGIATYFRGYLDGFMKDWIKENPKPDGTKYNLYNDGLKIYTTIDSRMQKYAEDAVQQHMPRFKLSFLIKIHQKESYSSIFRS